MSEGIKTQQKYEEEEEIDLIDYGRIIWRRKWKIILIATIIITLASIYTFLSPKIYESSILIEIGKIKDNYLESQDDIIVFLEQLLMSRSLTSELGLKEEQWPILKKSIKVRKVGSFIKITAQDKDPAKAKQKVEIMADLLIKRHQQMFAQEKKIRNAEIEQIKKYIQEIKENITKLEKEFARVKNAKTEGEGLLAQGYLTVLEKEKSNLRTLNQELIEKERETSSGSYETKIIVPSEWPLKPVKPNKLLNISIAAILGVFVGIFWAFLKEYLEKKQLIESGFNN